MMSGVTVACSSSSPNFRIDVIVNSLRELQQEKERLQQHSNEEKARCKSLEMKLEASQAKYYQSSERNCKMLETVNAAKQKVLQTRMQANRLKELNDGKGAKIQELRKQIDEETKKEQTELQMFEEKLAELTNNFRDAKNYYTEENVQQEIEEWSKQAEKAKAEVSKEDGTLKELSEKFYQMEMENKQAKDQINGKLEFGLTLEELELALKVFEAMNQETKEKLQITEQQLEQEINRLEQAKHDCQQRNMSVLSPDESNTADNSVLVQPSVAPYMAADQEGSVSHMDSTLNEDHQRPPKENYHQHQFRLESPSVAPTSKEAGAVEQTQIRAEERRSSLQGRSFFISLPVTPSN